MRVQPKGKANNFENKLEMGKEENSDNDEDDEDDEGEKKSKSA